MRDITKPVGVENVARHLEKSIALAFVLMGIDWLTLASKSTATVTRHAGSAQKIALASRMRQSAVSQHMNYLVGLSAER